MTTLPPPRSDASNFYYAIGCLGCTIFSYDFLQTFGGGLEGARGRLDEVTEVAAELARNCDSSVSSHFGDNVIAVSERFSRISGQLQEKLKQQKDLLETWQKFRSACAELVDWIEKQETLLAETVTINVPLNLQLQQLEICQVSTNIWLTL